MELHHPDCDVYQATLATKGPYGDPDIDPMEYTCLSECEEDSLTWKVAQMVSLYTDSTVEQAHMTAASEIISIVTLDFVRKLKKELKVN